MNNFFAMKPSLLIKLLLLLFLIALGFGCSKQSEKDKRESKKKVFPEKHFILNNIAKMPTGGYYIALNDSIRKIDKEGKLIWSKGFEGNIELTCIVNTEDGYLVGGKKNYEDRQDDIFFNRKNDYFLCKFSKSDIAEWERSFGGDGNDYLRQLTSTSDGGFILGGDSDSRISGDKTSENIGKFTSWLVKIDANGNKVWDKCVGTGWRDEFTAGILNSEGNYIMTGSGEYDGINNNYAIIFAQVDKNGKLKHLKNIGYFKDSSIISSTIALSPDGNYILGSQNFKLIEVNKQGKKIWERDFNYFSDFSDSHLYSIISNRDGTFYLTGIYLPSKFKLQEDDPYNHQDFHFQYCVLKVDSKGNKLWSKTYASNTNSILISPEGEVLLGCIVESSSNRNWKIIKVVE